ncbi:hypothetical protein Tco_1371547 [Tanacetum coccineum]
MVNLKFADTHNMVAFLTKPTESEGFEQIVDFLNANPIRYTLTINPTIYTLCIQQFWATVKAKTINGEVQLQALVDGKKIIITELIMRRDLQLEDAEGVDYLPNVTIFEELTRMGKQKHRKPKRKDTKIPQSSGPTNNVAYETVNKEMDDSLVRAATTASSLEAEQDSVLALETTKTTQSMEITGLKRRVKKLERRNKSRTHGLKRLYKGRRIHDIDADEDITLVNDQDDADMFDVNTLTGDEMLAEPEVAVKDVILSVDEVTLAQALAALKSAKPKVKGDVIKEPMVPVSAANTKVSTATTTTITIPTPRKGIVIQGADTTTTISSQQPSHANVQDKGKGKMVEEEPVKSMKKKDLIRLDKEIASKLQAEFDEEERLAIEKEEANVALTEEWNDIQAKIEADQLLAERLQAREQEELTIEERAILFQQLLEKKESTLQQKGQKKRGTDH